MTSLHSGCLRHILISRSVSTDTCAAMHEYTLDPTNTTLDTILPCVDRASAQNTLRTARRSVDRLVNATNGQITTLNAQLASGGAATVLPFVCLPYGGEPDYPPIPCPSGQVDPLQLSTVSCHVACCFSASPPDQGRRLILSYGFPC